MLVWVVEDQRAGAGAALASLLKRLAERAAGELRLLGAGPLTAGGADWLRGQAPDLLVVDEPAWPDAAWAEDVLAAGAGVVAVTAPERAPRFRALAERYPLVLVPPAPTPEALWLALLGAGAARQRQQDCREQLERLQQRLEDRILIERAKGELVRRLNISEDDAYNRLRVLSRRQRRPMRDVARSFLDTQDLLAPGGDGPDAPDQADATNGAGETSLPR
jgi:AmiR/NasT family two-component response regulator